MISNELNTDSDRYRVCPNCDLEFMANHRNRYYCSDKCGDELNNRKNKLNRMCEPPELLKIEPLTHPTETEVVDKKRNNDLLRALYIPPEGKKVLIRYLSDVGFNWAEHDGRILVKSSNGGCMALYGHYMITWEDDYNVFIQLKTK